MRAFLVLALLLPAVARADGDSVRGEVAGGIAAATASAGAAELLRRRRKRHRTARQVVNDHAEKHGWDEQRQELEVRGLIRRRKKGRRRG